MQEKEIERCLWWHAWNSRLLPVTCIDLLPVCPCLTGGKLSPACPICVTRWMEKRNTWIEGRRHSVLRWRVGCTWKEEQPPAHTWLERNRVIQLLCCFVLNWSSPADTSASSPRRNGDGAIGLWPSNSFGLYLYIFAFYLPPSGRRWLTDVGPSLRFLPC